MAEQLNRTVDRLIEELIRVSHITQWSKVRIVDGHVEPDEWSLARDAFRWFAFGRDSRIVTRKHLENLYEQVFEAVRTLVNTYPLLNVLLPGSTALSSMEDQSYLVHKKWLDLLGVWIERSAAGLRHLHDSYDRKVPKFEMLADQSIQQAKEIVELSGKLDRAYASKVKLPPLMSLSNNSNNSNNGSSTNPALERDTTNCNNNGATSINTTATATSLDPTNDLHGGAPHPQQQYTVLSGHLSTCRLTPLLPLAGSASSPCLTNLAHAASSNNMAGAGAAAAAVPTPKGSSCVRDSSLLLEPVSFASTRFRSNSQESKDVSAIGSNNNGTAED